jgi:hypothetical protein
MMRLQPIESLTVPSLRAYLHKMQHIVQTQCLVICRHDTPTADARVTSDDESDKAALLLLTSCASAAHVLKGLLSNSANQCNPA